MAINCVAPSQKRKFDDKDEFVGFYKPPRYFQPHPLQVSRGIVPFKYLELGDRFLGCRQPSDITDVLLVEGFWVRPCWESMGLYVVGWADMPEKEREGHRYKLEPWQSDYDKTRKAARERVKKRRARSSLAQEEQG